MLKIGLTGGIGSGKTTVSKIFGALGIPVFYSDIEAAILTRDAAVKKKICIVFGNNILDKYGRIDRKLLAKQVFSDSKKLEKLNSIIHPALAKIFEGWVKKNNTHPYILKEAAILFESGSHKKLDFIITVTSPIQMRIERVIKRENISKKQVEERMKHQMSDKEKIKLSDFVIINNEDKMLIPQVLEIHKKLLSF